LLIATILIFKKIYWDLPFLFCTESRRQTEGVVIVTGVRGCRATVGSLTTWRSAGSWSTACTAATLSTYCSRGRAVGVVSAGLAVDTVAAPVIWWKAKEKSSLN